MTISSLIQRLSVLKEKHGDLVVCLHDEMSQLYVPLLNEELKNGVNVVEVPEAIDGTYDSTKLDGTSDDKVVVIQWTA